MKRVACEFEADVLRAVWGSQWPEELRAHAAGCDVCKDVAAVAGAFDGAREELAGSAELPDAGRVWRMSQLRARREAVRVAGRPITAVQVIAFAGATGLIGAFFGATSEWFQALVKRVDLAGASTALMKVLVEHGAFVGGMAAIVLLVPTAVYVAMGRE